MATTFSVGSIDLYSSRHVGNSASSSNVAKISVGEGVSIKSS